MHIEDILHENGVYISTTVGRSMYPMLRDRRDTVIIRPVEGKLKKYDVPLYRRGRDYVLHRIVKVTPDGYVICGDNCLHKEYQVTDEQIIGVLKGFYRGDREIDMDGNGYRLYCHLWVAAYPLRYVVKRFWRIVKRLVKKVRK